MNPNYTVVGCKSRLGSDDCRIQAEWYLQIQRIHTRLMRIRVGLNETLFISVKLRPASRLGTSRLEFTESTQKTSVKKLIPSPRLHAWCPSHSSPPAPATAATATVASSPTYSLVLFSPLLSSFPISTFLWSPSHTYCLLSSLLFVDPLLPTITLYSLLILAYVNDTLKML